MPAALCGPFEAVRFYLMGWGNIFGCLCAYGLSSQHPNIYWDNKNLIPDVV